MTPDNEKSRATCEKNTHYEELIKNQDERIIKLGEKINYQS